jgi:hypothetical protein
MLENGAGRTWSIQCRRYKAASAAVLKSAIDEVLRSGNPTPDVLVVAVACDVQRKAHETFERYALSKGVGQAVLWSASVLEARLRAERRDLLFAFFGLAAPRETRERERRITRNIALKRRMHADLLEKPGVPLKKFGEPWHHFRHHTFLVRSIDDSAYPEIDTTLSGISSWFKLEVYDFYHNGLEFILDIRYVQIGSDLRWRLVSHEEHRGDPRPEWTKVWVLGQVPYRNIIDYDMIGDEYYGEPHLFCVFADGGTPYEGRRYVIISDSDRQQLDPRLQVITGAASRKARRKRQA